MKRVFFVKIDSREDCHWYKNTNYIKFKVKADRVIICDLHEEQAGYGLLMACGCQKKDVKYRCSVGNGEKSYRNMHHLSLGCIGSIMREFSDIGFICEPNIIPGRLLVEEVINGKRVKLCDLDLISNKDFDGFDSRDNSIISRAKRKVKKEDYYYFFKNKE